MQENAYGTGPSRANKKANKKHAKDESSEEEEDT